MQKYIDNRYTIGHYKAKTNKLISGEVISVANKIIRC